MNKALLVCGVMLLAAGCAVGPHYSRPSAPVPPAFKEAPPEGWKEAQPNDAMIRGKWWEIYNIPELNVLEEQVSISNQNVRQAEAQFRAARDQIRIARSALFPIVSTSPSITSSRSGGGSTNVNAGSGIRNSFSLPVDFSYQLDLWGSIRRSVTESAENAQASAAQLENVRLTLFPIARFRWQSAVIGKHRQVL
jgi:outer membrane protein TolC